MNLQQNVQIGNGWPAKLGPEAMCLNNLVAEYATNKAEADRLTARNAEIADQLLPCASFKDGSDTGHLVADGYKVTITRRANTKWLKDKLEEARSKMSDALFFKVFAWEYKPRSKKDLDGFLAHADPEFRRLVLTAMETSPGKPGVKVEALQ